VSRSHSHAVVSERSVNECHYKSVCICVRLLMREGEREREYVCVRCERACIRARVVCVLHSACAHTACTEDGGNMYINRRDMFSSSCLFIVSNFFVKLWRVVI